MVNVDCISNHEGRVLVIGASGFVGTHLVERLHSNGVEVICVDFNPPRKVIPGVKYIDYDIRGRDIGSIPKVDAIYNLAAVHTTPGHEDSEYYDTNISGALFACDVAQRDNVSTIVFTSSISVYGPSEEAKTEASEPSPISAYGKSKLFAELIHLDWARRGDAKRLVIVRPAVVFGKGEGGNFTRMAKLLRAGLFVFPGRRDTIKSCIYVHDLLSLIFFAESQSEEISIVNGSYPECPTLESIVGIMRDNYFPRVKFVDLPENFVMAAASILSSLRGLGLGVHPERVQKLTKSTNIYPEWAVSRGFFQNRSFAAGIAQWANATNEKFE